MSLRYFLIVLFIAGHFFSKGQQFDSLPKLLPSYVNSFSDESNSLSDKCYSEVFYDDSGRLWLVPCGVDRLINSLGLLVFDGNNVEPVEAIFEDSIYIDAPDILGIDEGGWLYLLNKFTQRLGRIHVDSRERQLIPFSSKDSSSVIKDAIINKGKLLVFAEKDKNSFGLFELRGTNLEEFQVLTSNSNLDDLGNHHLYIIEDRLFIGSVYTDRLLWWDLNSGQFHKWDGLQNINAYKRDQIKNKENPSLDHNMTKGNDGNFYISRTGQASIIAYIFEEEQFKAKSVVEFFPKNWKFSAIYSDDVGNQCILFLDGDNNYRALLSTKNETYYDYTEVIQDYSRILNIKSRNYFKEAIILTNGGFHISGVQPENFISSSLEGKRVSSMFTHPEGQLIVNTIRSGWYKVDKSTGTFADYNGSDCGLPNNPFDQGMKQQIIADTKGNHWFIDHDYLVKYDPVSESCETFKLLKNTSLFALVNDSIAIYQYSRNDILFLNLKSGQSFDFNPLIPNQLKGFVRDIYVDDRQVIWIPTNEGLYRIDYRGKNYEVLGLEDGFSDFRFTTVYPDNQNRLWVGTFLGGINIYDPKNGEVIVINEDDGLTSNSVMSIISDDESQMWVATEFGLNILSESGDVLNNLYEEDGLLVNKFERFDPYKDQNGILYFGCSNGLSILDPAKIKAYFENRNAARLYLTELSYYDRNQKKDIVIKEGLNNLGTITISPVRPYIKLKYALSSYIELNKNRFAYKFEGLDDNWNFIGNQTTLNIGRLPPGKYSLIIEGTDYRNKKSSNQLQIKIHAKDFFYNKLWFYYIVSIPFIAFGLIWARNKQLESKRLEREVDIRTKKILEDKILIENQAKELQQLDKLKSRFFTNISHELRTPITLIKTPLENIMQKYSNSFDKGIANGLNVILKNAGKLATLVEELLELSRIDAKKASLNESPTPLTLYCKHLFDAYSVGADLKEIIYQFDADLPEDEFYLIDRKKVEKIINNLISNALKFTPKGGSIKLDVKREKEQIIVKVMDTGRGIPEEDLPHLFDRFFQTRKEEISKEGGTGIGLSLSRELANVMDGNLEVQSTWGKGSTFIFKLPAKPTDKGRLNDVSFESSRPKLGIDKVIDADPVDHKPTKGQSRILIVEDNPDMQGLLLSLLEDQYQCIVADNGAEAWNMLEKQQDEIKDIELILSDIMMPEMNGYELLERIKQHVHWQRLPVIMLTAMSAEHDKLQALRLGVDDYLKKPFSAEELTVRISNLISNYEKRKAVIEETLPENEGIQIEFEPQESANQLWLEAVEKSAKEALKAGFKLTTSYLSSKVFISERQFSRKIKTLTGLTPNEYIQEVKLQKARHLLENGVYTTINEVAAECGFSSGSYLNKLYQEHFGKKPSEYL